MLPLAVILTAVTFLAGWVYLFHSRAAARLGVLEDEAANQRRIRLRRINGFFMLLLGASFFAILWLATQETGSPLVFALVCLATFVLLFVVVLLVLIDLRLTLRLRASRLRTLNEPPEQNKGQDRP